MDWLNLFASTSKPIAILDSAIPILDYCPINLSFSNKDLDAFDITDPKSCQDYINQILLANGSQVAYGGYLEKRNLYSNSERFAEGAQRNIHLGMDFWCEAGTKVITPLNGVVHSFENNSDQGNYGPTIILEHKLSDVICYSLYGHLSLKSLKGLYIGMPFNRGTVLATLGETAINVNYAPHLHFQLIHDIQGYAGDYPGVCSSSNLDFYQNNCPDPNLLLGLS